MEPVQDKEVQDLKEEDKDKKKVNVKMNFLKLLLIFWIICYLVVLFTMLKTKDANARLFMQTQKSPIYIIVSFITSPILIYIWVVNKIK